MPDDVLSQLQQLLATAGAAMPGAYPAMRPAAGEWPGPPGMAAQSPDAMRQALEQLQQQMGRADAAPPSAWPAPPTDLPLPRGQPMNLVGGDRVFRPGGTIGTRLGMNEAGIYGRSVPMGNQDTVVPATPQVPAMPTAQAGINPNALPLILRRVFAANPQLGNALNQLMAPR